MTNPYLNRTAIRDDASFVGRAAELKRLFNRIGGPQPQSVSIVGDRRIGKSSILRALMARRGRFLAAPDRYTFVYLDMQSRLRWTPETFFERITAEIAAAGVNINPITDYDGLERWCRALQNEGRALVLLIDEFQVLMREDAAANQLPVEFFNYLRSLANSYPVSLVVTSHVDLYTLSLDHRLSGSPLFNILHKLHLGPFTEPEAKELIHVAAVKAGSALTHDEPWIVGRAGYHPLYLQIACSAAFEWRAENGTQLPLDREQVDRVFMEEARPHFEGTWKLFTDTEREAMSALANGHAAHTGLAPTIEDLEERGYLRRDAGRLIVFSECFRDFVREQVAAEASGDAGVRTDALPVLPSAKVFISYAREDQDAVKDLYGRLQRIGLQPWMDAENLIVGDPWARTIDDAIQSADFFLFCISTYSVSKEGVLHQELARGLNQWYARSGPDNYLLPVMLEECEMPKSLAALQRVDLWREDGWVRLADGLRQAIERRKDKPLAPVMPATVSAPARPSGRRLSTAVMKTVDWVERRALVLGLTFFFIGVLLLIGGLSGEALSTLIERVGLKRARPWNVALRWIEMSALVFGALLISVALARQRGRRFAVALGAVLWLGCWMLITVDVPAPAAFALAYDRHLVKGSDDWRRRLLTFSDPETGGIRDGSSDTKVQAWTTAQAVVGVLGNIDYNKSKLSAKEQDQIRNAVNYLDRVRVPPPDEGWGYFEGTVPAITEVTAWAALAEIASVRANLWDPNSRAIVAGRVDRDLKTLLRRQTPSGGWSPIRDLRDDNTRTYPTVMALWALGAAFREGLVTDLGAKHCVMKGINWLLNERHAQLGWVPNPRRRFQTEDFPGLTAQALVVLELLREQVSEGGASDIRLRDAKIKFAEGTLVNLSIRANARVPDTDVHVTLGQASETLEGSSFLWYPWSRAAMTLLAHDAELPPEVRERARREAAALTLRTEELTEYLNNGLPYQLAENLFSIRIATDAAVK